jgi:hypothetical protein
MAKAKWLKTALVTSLLLNVCLVAGFVFFRKYMRDTHFELIATVYEGETRMLEDILSDLESNDPARISALKERLDVNIETGQKTSIKFWKATGRFQKPTEQKQDE